jgi:hypothetical protein
MFEPYRVAYAQRRDVAGTGAGWMPERLAGIDGTQASRESLPEHRSMRGSIAFTMIGPARRR